MNNDTKKLILDRVGSIKSARVKKYVHESLLRKIDQAGDAAPAWLESLESNFKSLKAKDAMEGFEPADFDDLWFVITGDKKRKASDILLMPGAGDGGDDGDQTHHYRLGKTGSMCQEILPPEPFDFKSPAEPPVVFLAGSIDMGEAEDWQKEIVESLADVPCVALNPRRKDWDKSWKQDMENPKFREQVEWELKGLEQCSVIALCLTKDSKAPISLLELGIHISDGKMIVHCPEGYWRKGNVDIVCTRYGVPVFESFEDFKRELHRKMSVVVKSPTRIMASDRRAWKMLARQFVAGMMEVRMASGNVKKLQDAFEGDFEYFRKWANPKRMEKIGEYASAKEAWDDNPMVEYKLTGWVRAAKAGMGDTHPFGSPLRRRPDYGERDGEVGEKYGLKLPSDGIMTSSDNMRVRVITDRIVGAAKEFLGMDRWDGIIEGPHIRLQWSDGRESAYRLEEMPVPGKKRLRLRSHSISPYARQKGRFLLMINVIAKSGINNSTTYDEAARRLDAAMHELLDEANEELDPKLSWNDMCRNPTETLVFYLEVEPSNTKPFIADGKDFKVELSWNQFKAYDPGSDFQQADPHYTMYKSKSPTAARKMYRMLKEDPNALKAIAWGAFGDWMRKNGIGYDTQFSQWH